MMTMEKQNRKLHLNIEGTRSILLHFWATRKASKLGLKTHSVSYLKEGDIELVLEGEKDKLWNMISIAKKGPLFRRLKNISFHFTDVPSDVIEVRVLAASAN